MKLLIGWLVNALALFITAKVVPGITVDGWQALLISALVIGIINATLKPLLHLISFPVSLVTFGLFALVINAALLGLAAWLVADFHIANFWAAFFGAIVLSIVSTILHTLANPKPVY